MPQNTTIENRYLPPDIKKPILPNIIYPDTLPVCQHREEIIAALQTHQVIVVAGETGSGKTTQLPKICLEIGRGVNGYIGHTQPRRVAARTIAGRIAEELRSPLGKFVGYKIRFSDQTREDTYIKLMTDGILLAELREDRLLSRYDTLIIDEAHERSLNIDFILGYLKQILPLRPDLKIIITSATLEPGRFAHYFNGAPILEIAGRTYPVEIRYRPLTDTVPPRDQITAISDAICELDTGDWGDILIFLSGEREIHDALHALNQLSLPNTEILPLYSRLNAKEQHRIFQQHSLRRIVLATNVAETSITVPGIRHVIDTGLARIKRYSYRSKIQRLPIEAISQASAKQRAGRCGRTAPGICIRLYTEEDFLSRPLFTEPEILRSNLASVILQMIHLGLGVVSQFPFIDPPDSRLIRDGYKLLEELAAIKGEQRLTKLGAQLARLPVDPRLGRMLIAAEKEGCIKELLIIVSALSIQDPRERPKEWQMAADIKHQLFADSRSDFLSFLTLWDTIKDHQQLSNKKFQQFCRDHFLSYLRIREWQDVHAQLTESVRELRLHCNQVSADYAAIHRAILSGLLGNIGFKQQEESNYLGARSIKFTIFPGSALFKKKPQWIMVAEIVETSRLYGRTVAKIEPEWVELLANHLMKRSYYEPHWEQRRNQVVAFEKKVLYGLIINPGKKINYGPVDPSLAREIFIREALVNGDFFCQADFFQHNATLLADIDNLESKIRRRDLMIDEQMLFDFYQQNLPVSIYDGVTLHHWLKTANEQEKKALFLDESYFIKREQVNEIAEQFPQRVTVNHIPMQLEYCFDPGHSADGVTAIIPFNVLNQISSCHFDWVVPGMLKEKIIYLIKALPKNYRRSFSPPVEYAKACLHSFTDDDKKRDLPLALAHQLKRISGIDIAPALWDVNALPNNLLMNFRIIDSGGQILAEGRHFDSLKAQLAPRLEHNLQLSPAKNWMRTGITAWDFGDLPDKVAFLQQGINVTSYPALLEKEQGVDLTLMADKSAAEKATFYGLRKLFVLSLAKEISFFKKNTKSNQFNKPFSLNTIINIAVQELFLKQFTVIRTLEAFENRLVQYRNQFVSQATLIAAILLECQQHQQKILPLLKSVPQATAMDIEEQLKNLFESQCISDIPWSWLQRIPTYLKAIQLRLDKVRGNSARDACYTKEVRLRWEQYQRHAAAGCQAELQEYRWLLEEYRVSLFAQELKTMQPVSQNRLDKLWQAHCKCCLSAR